MLAACEPRPSGRVASGPAAGDAVEILADDSFFAPERVELPAGEPVSLEIRNVGDVPHEFSIDELDISTGTIEANEVMTVTLEVPKGSTEFVCAFHGGMRGEIIGLVDE